MLSFHHVQATDVAASNDAALLGIISSPQTTPPGVMVGEPVQKLAVLTSSDVIPFKTRSKLDNIRNWTQLAAACHFSAQKLADRCGVSDRQLRRYFNQTKGTTPRRYLQQLRLSAGREMLETGGCVKLASQAAGYSLPSNYTRAFKRMNGYPPTGFGSDKVSSEICPIMNGRDC